MKSINSLPQMQAVKVNRLESHLCENELGGGGYPDRDPADINEVALLGTRAPSSHEHGDVAAGQSKNEVEKAVVVRDGLKLLHCCTTLIACSSNLQPECWPSVERDGHLGRV